MTELRTNLGLLMALMGVEGADITRLTGADKTLVSRWKNGGRRLMPGHGWLEQIADLFLKKDALNARTVVAALLSRAYGGDKLDGEALRGRLCEWLSAPGQTHPAAISARGKLYAAFSPAPVRKTAKVPGDSLPARTVEGAALTQETLLSALLSLQRLKQPTEITFVCTEGLDLITRYEAIGKSMLKGVVRVLRAGHHITAVLRTDFRISDVAVFAGPWLVAHLSGNLRSVYYEDFHPTSTAVMLLVAKGAFAIQISGKGPQCQTFTEKSAIARLEAACQEHIAHSAPRFCYGFFEAPQNFLQGARNWTDGASCLFTQLPHFSVGGMDVTGRLGVSQQERAMLQEQFAPLFIPPDVFPRGTPVRHIFSRDAISRALDKPKHKCLVLSTALGRSVFMQTQTLVDQLSEISRLLETCPDYQVSFAPDELFSQLVMEIAVWGSTGAICWVPRRDSTACKDASNTGALRGYCASVWERLPAAARSHSAAKRELSIWLRRAKKLGYRVA